MEPELNTNNDDSDDSHNKKKLKKKNKKMKIPTVSIAVPGSIIDNVPTLELATRVLSIQDPPFSIFSIFPSFFLILFSLFSWLVKSLVPQPFSESTRLLKLLCSLHFHILLNNNNNNNNDNNNNNNNLLVLIIIAIFFADIVLIVICVHRWLCLTIKVTQIMIPCWIMWVMKVVLLF